MKFSDQMKQIAWKLESKCGYNVIQCVYNGENDEIDAEILNRLVAAHYKKIDMCDAVYIVDIDGYIGPSVHDEIAYAKKAGKEVVYHSEYFIGG